MAAAGKRTIKVAALCGSLRAASFHGGLLRAGTFTLPLSLSQDDMNTFVTGYVFGDYIYSDEGVGVDPRIGDRVH